MPPHPFLYRSCPGRRAYSPAPGVRGLSAKESTGVILALLLIGDTIALWAYRRDANTAVLRRLIPSVLTSVGLGALLLAMSTQAQMRRTIGAILLALVLVTLAQRRWGTPQPRPRPAPRHGRASRTTKCLTRITSAAIVGHEDTTVGEKGRAMTWFSSMIPGAPGNADSIALVAQTLHESATQAENIEQAVSRIPSSISTWKGHAHLDYLESQQRARSRMIHFNEGMACAANDVESYSWSVRAMHNYVENTLRPTAQELDEAFTRTPAGQRINAYFSLLAEARTLQGEYRERYNRLKQEAEDLALSLQQALSIEPVAKKSKFAGGFFDPSRTERLSERDIDRINAELKALREGSFDLRAIAQGSIGDCYYLASLMAVMNSPEGQALLADGIRPHYNQDGTIDGYIVTVYDKPGFFSSGSSTEVLVRDTYANGARSSGSAGVISLYEKAFSQLHPGGVNRSTFFESGITAGYPREALPRVTGQGTSTVDGDGLFGFGSGYDAGEQQTIIEAANSGQPTIANTEFSDAFTNRTAPVDVTLPNGQETRIDIYRGHDYVVTHADSSGLTLVNPHGTNTVSETGSATPTGEFTISWENFNEYYGNVTLGAVK